MSEQAASKAPRSTTKFRRELSAMERMSLHMPNPNVVVAAHLSEHLAASAIQRSLPALCRRHPLLAVRTEVTDSGKASFTTDHVDSPQVNEYTLALDEPWHSHVAIEHKERIDWQTGPMARFRLLQHEGKTIILVTAHHAICDGLSLVYLLRDLLDVIWTGEFDAHTASPVSIRDAAPSLRSSFIEKAMLAAMSRKWRAQGVCFRPDDSTRLHEVFWKSHQSALWTGDLGVDETKKLIQLCHVESISIGNIVNAAFLKAQQQHQPDRDINNTTLVAASIRHLLAPKPRQALGFYATGVRVGYSYNLRQPLRANARAFGQRLTPLLTPKTLFAMLRLAPLDPGLIDALAYARGGLCSNPLALRFLKRTGKDRVMAGLLMSNLGAVPITSERRPPIVDSVFGPMVLSDSTEKYVGTLTVRERLHFSVSYDASITSREQVEAVGETALQELRSLSKVKS